MAVFFDGNNLYFSRGNDFNVINDTHHYFAYLSNSEMDSSLLAEIVYRVFIGDGFNLCLYILWKFIATKN